MVLRKAFQSFPSTRRFKYLVTGILKCRNYKPQYPQIIINDQNCFWCVPVHQKELQFYCHTWLELGANIIISSDAVTRTPSAQSIFTSSAETDMGGWASCVGTHTYLPGERCGGQDSTRYSYTPTKHSQGRSPICALYFMVRRCVYHKQVFTSPLTVAIASASRQRSPPSRTFSLLQMPEPRW
jgi:hypothetical protein